MKKSESIRISLKAYQIVKEEAKKNRRTITETINIMLEQYAANTI